MSPGLDPMDVERRLRRLPVTPAPASLWDGIRAALDSPAATRPAPTRRSVPGWLAAAAVVLAIVAGMLAGVVRSYRAPAAWPVVPLGGTPTIAGAALTAAAELRPGAWLVTDAGSRARLAVGRIGTADVGPNSRVRMERGGLTEHRLTLERGELRAVIAAPPRLFFVRTPSALATDLGCAYTLEVDAAGRSRLHVTAGWVELHGGDGPTLVPAGLVAEVTAGGRPGTPYPEGLPAQARAALHRLDGGSASALDLDVVVDALQSPSDFVTRRRQGGITLWHLLQRAPPALRGPVYQRLADLSPPPAGVTREGILALQRPMLERWRRDLSPMWSEEAQAWWTRAGRQLWEWTMQRGE